MPDRRPRPRDFDPPQVGTADTDEIVLADRGAGDLDPDELADRGPGDLDPDELADRGPGDRDELEPEPAQGIRLQKVLAAAGVGSRRHAEEMIAGGRVRVDGKVVRTQGMRVDPDAAVIEVDGERVVTRSGLVHMVLNKPRGVVSAMSDDRGRPTVGEYVADRAERLYHVGRLDQDSEGLLLFTNDGELAHRLTHPSYEVEKTYLAEVPGPVERDLGRRLRRGIELEDGPATVDKFHLIETVGGRAMLEITIHEGRNRLVRRMLETAGYPVRRLVRVRIGPVHLGNLKSGRLRHLTRHEVGALYRAVDL